MEPLVPRHGRRARYPFGFLLAAATVGIAGWASQPSRFEPPPAAQPVAVAMSAPRVERVATTLPVLPAEMVYAEAAEPASGLPAPVPVLAEEARRPAAIPAVHASPGPTRKDAAHRARPSEIARAAMLAQIARMKAVLKLTPAQEPYWPPVEAVLRDVARQQAGAVASGRSGAKPGKLTIGEADMQRLTSAAFPLLMALREDQKHDALQLARAMGLENVASAF